MINTRPINRTVIKKTIKDILVDSSIVLTNREYEVLFSLLTNFSPSDISFYVRLYEEIKEKGEDLTILECGSGFTSLYIGLLLKNFGGSIISLENNEKIYSDVLECCNYFDLYNQILLVKYKNNNELLWYDIKDKFLGKCFNYIVCDGPLTPESRGGLLNVNQCFLSNVKILLDDAIDFRVDFIDEWGDVFNLKEINRDGRWMEFQKNN